MPEERKIPERGYAAEAVANWFIQKAMEDSKPINHLKLQKIVYITHGWSLALLDRPLINEEAQAWKYGPVIKSLYHALKHYGRGGITELLSILDVRNGDLVVVKPTTPQSDDDVHELLERVWKVYGKATTGQLVEATHMDETPWKEFYQEGNLNITIPNRKVKRYYEGLAKARSSKAA